MPSLVLTILAVRDLPRMKAFYRAAFDWPLVVDVEVYAEFKMANGQRLGVYAEDGFAVNTTEAPPPTPAGAITRTELYFACDDLGAAVARALAAGARQLSPAAPRGWGDEVAYVADPEGNVLALARVSAAG